MNIAKGIVREIGNIPYISDAVTKEALVLNMSENTQVYEDPETKKPIEYTPMTIFAGELCEFFSMSNMNMVNFLTTIFGESTYDFKTKNKGTQHLEKPYVVFIACTTPEYISARLRDDVISGGFSRRAIFVYDIEETVRTAFPEITPEMVKAYQWMIEWGKKLQSVCGEFAWEQDARDWYIKWYNELTFGTDTSTIGYYRSKHTQLLRVAMLVALSYDTSLVMKIEHLQLAEAFLLKMEVNLPKVFEGVGRNELSGVAQKIMSILCAHKCPVLEKKVYAQIYRDANGEEIANVLRHLISTDKVVRFVDAKSGTMLCAKGYEEVQPS